MISRGESILYGETIEVYLGRDGIMIWYRRDTSGPEWVSMAYRMIPFADT